MAMPTSAAASAGASLMPSPTIATAWPAAAQLRCTTAPCRPAAPRHAPRRCPAARATASALPRLSPVSMHGARCPARAGARRPRAAPGLTASPKASRPSSCAALRRLAASQPRHGAALRPAALGARACQRRRRRRRARASARCCPAQQRGRRTAPCDAAAGQRPAASCACGHGSCRRPRRVPARRAPADVRCRPAARRPARSSVVARSARLPAAAATSCGRPSVSVPVLSKATTVTRVRQLQRLRVLDQDAVPRRHAGADHDRRRRGQAQRAGAGDHQHRDRVEHGRLPSRPRPSPSPAA